MQVNKIPNLKTSTVFLSTKSYRNIQATNKLFGYIENSSQLKTILYKDPTPNLKTLFILIISSFNSFGTKNHQMFYHILSAMIDKIASSSALISYDNSLLTQYTKFLYQTYDHYMQLLNVRFENLFLCESLVYLASQSRHSIIVLLYALMTGFTYVNYEMEECKTSKREVYHLLKGIRMKYMCREMERLMCPVCSLNSVELINQYVTGFISCGKGKSYSVGRVCEEYKGGSSNVKEKDRENGKGVRNSLANTNSNSSSGGGEDMEGNIRMISNMMDSIYKELGNLEEMIKVDQSQTDNMKEMLKALK